MDCLYWDEHTGKCLNGNIKNYGKECDGSESYPCFFPQKDPQEIPCFYCGTDGNCHAGSHYGTICMGKICRDYTAINARIVQKNEQCFWSNEHGQCTSRDSHHRGFTCTGSGCWFYRPPEEIFSDQTAKADAGKPRLTLVPRKIIWAIAKVREFGTKKYKDSDNWKRVTAERYRDALFRHLLAYLDDPNGKDPESGLPILWHVATNVAFLVDLEWNDEEH